MHAIKLDIRWPIGILFALQGALLAVYGYVQAPDGSSGFNGRGANHLWGVAMLLFGLVMIALAWRHRRATTGGAAKG